MQASPAGLDMDVGDGATKIRINRPELSFSAAHFTIFGPGKRERLHGHDYRVGFEYVASPDEAGLVIDYRVAKVALGEICRDLNERMLIPGRSPFLVVSEGPDHVQCLFNGERFVFPHEDVRVVDVTNVTLEAMSHWIATRLHQALASSGVLLKDLRVFVSASGEQSAEFLIVDE